MSNVRVWHSDFRHYEDLVGIECVHRKDIGTLIGAFYTRELRTCPRETIVNTIVVPKEAMAFLPLDRIEHSVVELRQTRYLEEKFINELQRRFELKGDELPHYYTTGTGRGRTCCRSFAPLKTVQEIEKSFEETNIS